MAVDHDRSLVGRTILAVFAHPDDESLACGGTLARASDAGARVVLLCASRGEHGSISDGALVPDGDLGRVRVHELRNAGVVLGISEITILDHPDGDLRWANVPILHNEIVMLIKRCRPDAIITFGEDGLYWHLDHIGIHERTYTAVLSLGEHAPPLYYVTMPEGAMKAIVEAAHTSEAVSGEAGLWGIAPEAFGEAARPPGFVIDVRDWVPRKLMALRCHRTQIAPTNPMSWIDDLEAQRWLGFEQFRRAPIASTGAPVLEQLAYSVAGS
jgi:LmbE family N-acetylglucosaminyl deacetylase